jgi:hypothetical protein
MDDIPRKLPQLFYFSAANLNNKSFIENISTVVVINATKIRLKSGKNAATIRKQNSTKIRLKFGKNAATIRKQNATKIRLMVWYVLLRSLRPELDGQMSCQIMESCVQLE